MTGDDYFDVDVSDIPQRRNKRKREEDPQAYEIASALKMISDCDHHPVVSAEQLREAEPTLYAIVFESNEKYVGFVRNASPRRRVRPGLKYLQYGNALKRVDPPDLAIDDLVDLVVTEDRCAVLDPRAFTTLFGDVGVAFRQVPTNVKAITNALKNVIPLRPDSASALTARCGRRVIDARRLHHIVAERQTALKALTPEEMRTLLDRRGLGDAVQEDELVLDQDAVSDFLDLIEGRLFADDVTGEERRADAYSPRQH